MKLLFTCSDSVTSTAKISVSILRLRYQLLILYGMLLKSKRRGLLWHNLVFIAKLMINWELHQV